jgi:hypothetical protein
MLRNDARPSSQHGDRVHFALIIEELRHADLLSQDSSYSSHFLLPSQLGPWLLAGELFVLFAKGLDLDIYARREIKLHQCIYGLLRRLENVEETLMGTNFELLARLLVHVRRTQDAVFVFHRGQWNRTRDLRAGTPSSFDDLTRGLIQNAIVVRFQPDANSLFSNHVSFPNPFRLFRKERAGGKLRATVT